MFSDLNCNNEKIPNLSFHEKADGLEELCFIKSPVDFISKKGTPQVLWKTKSTNLLTNLGRMHFLLFS